MANKYELRRRALKETQGRSENPYASPRYGGRAQPRDWTPYAPPPPMDRPLATLFLCLGLFLLILALYGQTWWHYNAQTWGGTNGLRWGHKFTVCDDNVYIYEKPQIVSGLTREHVVWAFADAHEGNWHPLTWISHMIDWQLFSGGSWEPANLRYKTSWPGGHHLVSMLLHCMNAVLLFLALRVMTGTLWPSFVVAVLFGVHPLRVESVAWAAERKDVLCGLFWMASMLAYAFYSRQRPIAQSSAGQILGSIGLYVLVCVFLGLGLMAKSMIVTLPCVFMLLDFWPLERWKRALWPLGQRESGPDMLSVVFLLVEKIPWFAMAYLDCSVTFYGQNKGVALNSWEGLPLLPRLWNAVVSCGEYLRQTFWPTGLAPFYSHPAMIPHGWTTDLRIRFAVYSVLLLAITGVAIYGAFSKRLFLGIGWFWYLGTLMPVIGIIQVGTQARADRYTYLPMIGVYLMIAWLLKGVADRWPATRIFLTAGSLVVLAALCVVTFCQVSYWVDSYKLFKHAKDVTVDNYFAYNHIGIAYDSDAKEIGRLDEKAADQLFEYVSKYFDGPPDHLDDALPQPLLAAGVDPGWFKSWLQENAAWLKEKEDLRKQREDLRQEREDLLKNLRRLPKEEENRLKEKENRLKEREDRLTRPVAPAGAIENFTAAAKKLNHLQKQTLLFDYSADAFQSTIDIKPDYDFGNNNLGVFFARRGQPEDLPQAEKYFRAALMSNQRYADAYNNLAIVLARQGGELAGKSKILDALKKFDEAIFFHRQGLNVRIDRASDHNNLCRVFLQKYDLEVKRGDSRSAEEDLHYAMMENDFALRQCDPNFLGAWMSRAEIRIKQNDLEGPQGAAACARRMVDIDPTATETLQTQMMIAAKHIEIAQRIGDQRAVEAGKHLNAAIEGLSQILAVNPNLADVYHARGVAFMLKGDFLHAQQDFARVQAMAPQYPGIQDKLRFVSEKLRNPSK